METGINESPKEVSKILQLAGMYSYGVIGDGGSRRMLLPIPNSDTGTLQLLVFYTPISRYPSNPNADVFLYPATHVITITPEGYFVRLERVSETLPPDVLDADDSLGAYVVDLSNEEFDHTYEELLKLYDQLLPAYVSDSVSPDLQKEKARFKYLFNQIHEKPLIYYYRTYGSQLFDWIGLN